MINQFFAQYLLNQGQLTPGQIREALESRRRVKVKLGILAISQGFLNAAQVEEIHRLQYTIDKKFGEVALDKGYLSEEQLNALLTMQENEQLNFGQILVDKGFMTLQQFEGVLEGFQRENSLGQYDDDTTLFREHIRSRLNLPGDDKRAELYCEYILLFMRSMVRFLDVSPLLVKTVEEQKGIQWLVSQNMSGDIALRSSFIAEDSVLLELACRYSGEKLNEINELAIDSAGEFFNVANGLFCINLSNRGLDIDLQPQTVVKSTAVSEEADCSLVIETGFGKIKLLLAGQ